MARITIGVPARNEASSLPVSLPALHLAVSLLPKTHQVETIVYANACTDQTAEVARRLGSQLPELNLRVVESKLLGKARAINAIKQASRADFLVFADADVVLHPRALKHLVEAAEQSPNLSAFTSFGVPRGFPASLRFLYRSWEKRPPTTTIRGGLFLVRRTDLPSLPEATRADDLYLSKVLKKRIGFVPEARHFYYAPRSFHEWAEYHFRFFRWSEEMKRPLWFFQPAQLDQSKNPSWLDHASHHAVRLTNRGLWYAYQVLKHIYPVGMSERLQSTKLGRQK